MIVLKSGTEKVNIKTEWTELTPEEYIKTVECLDLLIGGNIKDIEEFRLLLLQRLTDYEPDPSITDVAEQHQIIQNLYRLSENMLFPLRPAYPNLEVLAIVSNELRERLQKHFIFDIWERRFADEIKLIQDVIEYRPVINFYFQKNLLPLIKIKSKKYHGPLFSIDLFGVVTTDLQAEEYIDAQEYYTLYSQTNDRRYLGLMASVLYRTNRDAYNSTKAQIAGEMFMELSNGHLKAVLYLFRYIQEFFLERSNYRILFRSSGKDEKREIALNGYATLYNLSEKGYGSLEEVKRINLLDYMNLCLKITIDAVHQMRAAKKKTTEIADALNMDFDTVLKIE